jgi:hypothetical protein
MTDIVEENAELRKIIAELGYCTPDASLEFMRLIPAEVKAQSAIVERRIGELEAALHKIANSSTELESASDYSRGWNAARFRMREIARASLEQRSDQ